jgi:small-conductance mechanosensitive channel
MNDQIQTALEWLSGAPLRIIAVLAGAVIAQWLGHRAISRAVNRLSTLDLRPGPGTAHRQAERARTIGSVLTSILNAVVWIVATAMVLGEFGFNLGPVIASAGIVGVAVGLGAQTLVRDILSGIFMLIEDQYGVGDRVDVLTINGVVERVGLRITAVRADDGTLWYIRNGEILTLGNASKK